MECRYEQSSHPPAATGWLPSKGFSVWRVFRCRVVWKRKAVGVKDTLSVFGVCLTKITTKPMYLGK